MKTFFNILLLIALSTNQTLAAGSNCGQLLIKTVPLEQLDAHLRTELQPFLSKISEAATNDIVTRLQSGMAENKISKLDLHKAAKKYFNALQAGNGNWFSRVTSRLEKSFSRTAIERNSTETEAFRREMESLVAAQGITLHSTPWIRARMWAINHPVIMSWAKFTALQVASSYLTYKTLGHINLIPVFLPRLDIWNYQGQARVQVSAKVYQKVAVVLAVVGVIALWAYLDFHPEKPIDMTEMFSSMKNSVGTISQESVQQILDAAKNLPDNDAF